MPKKVTMKNLTFLFAMLSFSLFSAQCVIKGPDQVQVGEKQLYTVDSNQEPCTNCLQWKHDDQNLIFETETNIPQVTIKGSVPGTAVLSVEGKSATGLLKCEKTIQIIAPLESILAPEKVECDIKVEELREFKTAQNKVTFESAPVGKNYTYTWTVTYRSGEKKISTDKTPQFDFSNENVISEVELKVNTPKCTRKLSKSYNDYFWYFF